MIRPGNGNRVVTSSGRRQKRMAGGDTGNLTLQAVPGMPAAAVRLMLNVAELVSSTA
jgi:hypothetical protein